LTVFEELSIEFRNDHIYLRHPEGFEISSESMDGFWDFLREQCEQFDCTSVLVEADAPKRTIDTVGAFNSGVEASRVAPNLWLALCFYNYVPDELSELFRQAVRNRGANVEFFSDCATALNWLRVNNSGF
jgi:hypothetical protein